MSLKTTISAAVAGAATAAIAITILTAPSCSLSAAQREDNLVTKAQLETVASGMHDLAETVNSGLQAANAATDDAADKIAALAQTLEQERARTDQLIADNPGQAREIATYADRLDAMHDAIGSLAASLGATDEARASIMNEVKAVADKVLAMADKIPAVIDQTGAVDPQAAADVANTAAGFLPEPYKSIALLGIAGVTAIGGSIFGTKRERAATAQPLYEALGDVVRGTKAVLESLTPEGRAAAEDALRARQTETTQKLVAAVRAQGRSGIIDKVVK